MKKMNEKLIVLLILGLLVHQHRVNCFIGAVFSIISFAWSAFEVLNTVHDTYSKFTTPSTADLMEKSEEIVESLDNWGNRIEQKIQESVDTLLTRLPLHAEIANNIGQLNNYVGRIDELYFDMKEYLEYPEYFDNASLTALVKTFTSRDGDDVQATVVHIHNLIVPPQKMGKLKKSLFLLLAQETRAYGLDLCDTGAPPQQRLVEIFEIAMEAEMKALAITGFGILMKGYLKSVNSSGNMKRFERKFFARAKSYLIVLKSTMSSATRQFRRCDPPEGYKQGVTSHEFVKFLGAFIIQEGVLPADWRCKENCEGYTQPTEGHPGCAGFECDALDCEGRLMKCESMNYRATVCQLAYTSTETRRYQWFKNGNEELYGSDIDGCPGYLRYAEKIEEYGYNCDVCKCICVKDGPGSMSSSYFISLRDQITDVNDNMVVIGVSFVIIDRIAHLKIQQGKLGSAAEIIKNSTVWLEPENIQFDWRGEKSIYFANEQTHYFFKTSASGENEELITEKDVAVLKWEKRRINLDTLSVRFRRNIKEKSKPIQLEIHGTRFDNETGQLDFDSSIWVTPDEMPYSKQYTRKDRVEYKEEGFRNPIKSINTKIDTKPYTFIDMDWSSLQYDAGQTTIPLLDGLPVTSQPSTPLVGVGIYHKKQPGYGGFLTLVLEGLNLAPFIPMDF